MCYMCTCIAIVGQMEFYGKGFDRKEQVGGGQQKKEQWEWSINRKEP